MGVHAVPGGEGVGQVGPHRFVDDDRAFHPKFGTRVSGQFGVGANPDHNEHEIDGAA